MPLSVNKAYARSPRFSVPKDGTAKLCFLSSTDGFPTHHAGVELSVLDWDTASDSANPDSLRTLVDTVKMPTLDDDANNHGSNNYTGSDGEDGTMPNDKVAGMTFPGLYMGQLPKNCCTKDYLLATTQWGSVVTVVRISLDDGTVRLFKTAIDSTDRKDDDSNNLTASTRLLSTTPDGGAILCRSSPNQPAVIGYVSPEGVEALSSDAVPIASMRPVAASTIASLSDDKVQKLLGFSFEVLTRRGTAFKTASNDEDESKECPVQWILITPQKSNESSSSSSLPPLLVVPHGGPHSCTPTWYNPAIAFLCGHGGYALLLVNYRGSIGFGEDSVNALPGNAGKLDVQDVVDATEAIGATGLVDKDRIGICGGSHGGFLTGHCIGQRPDLFKVAALRNPVTNIASMVTATDIPDWCQVEAMGQWTDPDKFRGPTKDQLMTMYDASPIRYADAVVAPTLVALGLRDLRVPPSQGLEYFHTLKSKGLATKLLEYPEDDHAIDRVQSEADHWIHIKRWFDAHL